MEFSITRGTLANILTKVGKVLNAKSSIPILSGLFIEVKEDEINFIASDSETTVALRLLSSDPSVSIIHVGTTVIPKEAFNTILKLQGVIDFKLNASKNTISIVQKDDNFKLDFQTFVAEEYPPVTEIPKGSIPVKMKANRFKHLIDETIHCVSTSDSRPILQSINFVVSENMIHAEATDSHRLAKVIDTDFSCKLPEGETIKLPVPAEVLKNISKALNLDEDIILLFSDNCFAAMNNNIIFTSSIFNGVYPDITRLIPNDFIANVTLNRNELLNTLNILSEVKEQGIVKMQFDDMFTTLIAEGSISKGKKEIAHKEIECETDLNIAFSADFLKQALLVLENTDVTINFKGAEAPFVLKENHNLFESVHLILPVRQY